MSDGFTSFLAHNHKNNNPDIIEIKLKILKMLQKLKEYEYNADAPYNEYGSHFPSISVSNKKLIKKMVSSSVDL